MGASADARRVSLFHEEASVAAEKRNNMCGYPCLRSLPRHLNSSLEPPPCPAECAQRNLVVLNKCTGHIFMMSRTTLVHCLEGDWGAWIRQMLTPEELLLLLQLKRSLPMRNLVWALRLREDVAALRTIMVSLRSTQLRFPGFSSPVTVHAGKVWTPPSPDDPLQTLGTVEHLLHWMEDFGLGGFTPSEAVLVMNAWPKTTRHAGAALSDFLTEAHAEFFYRTGVTSVMPGSPFKTLMARAVIFFVYKGLRGVLQIRAPTC